MDETKAFLSDATLKHMLRTNKQTQIPDVLTATVWLISLPFKSLNGSAEYRGIFMHNTI